VVSIRRGIIIGEEEIGRTASKNPKKAIV